MKKFAFIISILFCSLYLNGQKLISKTGHIWFYSSTPLEEIEAHNHQVASILDPSNGDIQVSLLMRSFEFKVELMQEHFNENYLQSDLFPKAILNGKIENLDNINFKKDGNYSAILSGELTIHGVTKPVKINGTIEIVKGAATAKAKFKVLTADYNIQIPDLVKEKIAKEIEITVEIPYQK